MLFARFAPKSLLTASTTHRLIVVCCCCSSAHLQPNPAMKQQPRVLQLFCFVFLSFIYNFALSVCAKCNYNWIYLNQMVSDGANSIITIILDSNWFGCTCYLTNNNKKRNAAQFRGIWCSIVLFDRLVFCRNPNASPLPLLLYTYTHTSVSVFCIKMKLHLLQK